MMDKAITLVGDGIENPANAHVMMAAADMFGCPCLFRDRYGLSAEWLAEERRLEEPKLFITYDQLAQSYSPIVACDNLEGAEDVYGFRLPGRPQPAVVVGNERRGIASDILSIAEYKVQIPMFVRGTGSVNSLNVAAASAVALYYLSRGGGAKMQTSAHPGKRRPELMLVGGQSHVELGSTIRSAGAFGWERILVEDRMGVWFGAGRGVKAEGRAAARRHRNPIHLIPTRRDSRYAFAEVCIVTARPAATARSTPIHRANLARGARQLLVIPDESGVDTGGAGGMGDSGGEEWHRLGHDVRFVHLDLPRKEFVYHYRLVASIALAEVARQVGRKELARTDSARRARRQRPFYDSALDLVFQEMGETVYLENLERY